MSAGKRKTKSATPAAEPVARASDFQMRRARFLWHPYAPMGKITILDGDPGRGKSMITVDLAARLITGTEMPTSIVVSRKRLPPRGVVLICAEDDWEDTILPRLWASVVALRPHLDAEAVRECLSRVGVIGLRRDEDGRVLPLEFPRDVGRVREAVEEVGARLVVVDPIMAFLGEKTNTGNDSSVRSALSPFKELAAETGAAFVLVRHLNKSTDLKAEYRGGGSHGGFIGLARSAWMVNHHPDDDGRMVFVHSKANLSRPGRAITYAIAGRTVVTDDGEPIETAGIEWGETIEMDADTLMRGHDSRRDAPAREECWADLCALLDEQEPRPADEIKRLLALAGHTADTIKRAKKHYGVRSVKRREGDRIAGWDWTREPGAEPVSDAAEVAG